MSLQIANPDQRHGTEHPLGRERHAAEHPLGRVHILVTDANQRDFYHCIAAKYPV